MTDGDFNWPKTGDRAFKPSISSADHARLEAFVMPSDGTYLVGFQRAADMIVDAAKTDDGNPDDLFFPVAYLYRHHLELMLKDLIRLGVRIGAIEAPADGQSETCPACGHRKGPQDWQSEHNLHKLWNKAKKLLTSASQDSPHGDVKAVEQVILEFHKRDPTGQAFRYARQKNGSLHLQSGPEHVDLGNLRSTVDTVSGFLDAAWADIDNSDPGPG